MDNNRITLTTTTIVRALVVACGVLVAASLAGQMVKYWGGRPYVYGLVPKFYLADERNLPTMFAVFLHSIAAVLLALIAVLKRRERDPYAARWKLLAIGFLCMAVDEGAELHELFKLPFQQLLGGGQLGIFNFAWVIPFGVLVIGLAVYFATFVWSLPRSTGLRFLLAGALFVGGALGFELIEGAYAEVHGVRNVTYMLLATVEETLEMAGVIVFILAVLKYIEAHYPAVTVNFGRMTHEEQAAPR